MSKNSSSTICISINWHIIAKFKKKKSKIASKFVIGLQWQLQVHFKAKNKMETPKYAKLNISILIELVLFLHQIIVDKKLNSNNVLV